MASQATKDATKSPRNPRSSMPRLETEVDRYVDRRWPSLFDWPRFTELAQAQTPHVDVIDRESDILVKAELPGFKKEDIDVSVTDNTMTIKASSRSESEEGDKANNGDYYIKEISRCHVTRTLHLPAEIDGEQAIAKYKDGVLEVSVPKAASAKRQRIQVES